MPLPPFYFLRCRSPPPLMICCFRTFTLLRSLLFFLTVWWEEQHPVHVLPTHLLLVLLLHPCSSKARHSLHWLHVQESLVRLMWVSNGAGGGCNTSQNLLLRSAFSCLIRAVVSAIFDNSSCTELWDCTTSVSLKLQSAFRMGIHASVLKKKKSCQKYLKRPSCSWQFCAKHASTTWRSTQWQEKLLPGSELTGLGIIQDCHDRWQRWMDSGREGTISCIKWLERF